MSAISSTNPPVRINEPPIAVPRELERLEADANSYNLLKKLKEYF